jgi:predicted DNA-binding transcriptional regulator YafY
MSVHAISRVLQVCEALQRATSPVCAGSLAIDLAERTKLPWSKRTVLRDLQALSQTGYVKSIGCGKRGTTVRWEWSGAGMLRTTA